MNSPFVIVTPWYGYFAGGAEVAARSLAEQLARRGSEVCVLTTCCRSPYESWWQDALPAGVEQSGGVTVHRFPVDAARAARFHEVAAQAAGGATLMPAQQLQYVENSINSSALIGYAKQLRADAILLALPYTQGLTYSLLTALPDRVILLPCLHEEPQATWAPSQRMLAAARRLFFLSEEEKSLAIRLAGLHLGRRVVQSPVIGVGVQLPPGVSADLTEVRRTALCEHHGLPERFFVYVGRKEAAKNLGMVVEAFDAYRAQGGTSALVFIGDGDAGLVPHRPECIDLGVVTAGDKYAIIAAATGLLQLSERESLGLAVLEAWLCGTPVVVSAGCAVTAAHCRRSGGGLPVASAAEGGAALRLLENARVRAQLARAGRRYVEAQYAWDVILDRFLRAIGTP